MAIRIDGTNTAANPGITGADADTGLQFGTDEIQLVTGGTNRATVESNGNFTIEDGNLVVAAGHGIDFSADANAAGMTGELLDDYERGTWTPFFCKTTSEENMFSGNQLKIYQANYQKIGDVVHYSCYIANSGAADGVTGFTYDTGRASTDPLSIGGLPYVVDSGAENFYAGVVGFFNAWVGWGTGYTPMCYAHVGKTSIVLNYAVVNTTTAITATYLGALGSGIMVSGSYVAA